MKTISRTIVASALGFSLASPVVAGLPTVSMELTVTHTGGSYISVQGMVGNVSDRALGSIKVMVVCRDAVGAFVDSGFDYVSHDVLMPGQTTTYKAYIDYNESIDTCGAVPMLDGRQINAVAPYTKPATKPVGAIMPDIRVLQEALKKLGYDPGPIDGVMGAKTRAAIKAVQKKSFPYAINSMRPIMLNAIVVKAKKVN